MKNTRNTIGYRVLLSEVTWRTVDVLAASAKDAEQLALDHPEWGRQGQYPAYLVEECDICTKPDFAPANTFGTPPARPSLLDALRHLVAVQDDALDPEHFLANHDIAGCTLCEARQAVRQAELGG